MLKILVADEDAFARCGQRLYLEKLGYEVLEAGDVHTAWEIAMTVQPSLAVINIILPVHCGELSPSSHAELNGLSLTIRLKKSYPSMGIVLLSTHHEHEKEVVHLAQQHWRSIAFLYKGGDMGRLNVALQEVRAGRTLYQHEGVNKYALATAVSTHFSSVEAPWIAQAAAELSQLTPREQEIAHLLSASFTSDHIAERLGLNKGSVDNAISRIYSRLGLTEMKMEETSLRPLPVLIKACLVYDIKNSR